MERYMKNLTKELVKTISPSDRKKISIETNNTNGKLVNKISACTIKRSFIKQVQINHSYVQGTLHHEPMQHQLQFPPKILG